MAAIANTIFSPELAARFDKLVTIYPVKRSALVPMLLYAQDEVGYISDEVITELAQRLDLLELDVRNVLSYYSMLRTRPAGRFNVQVCTNISCMLRGGYEVLEAFEKNLGLKRGESNSDFTLIEEECIAACEFAPCAVVGTKYLLDLTPAKVPEAIAELRGKPHPESEVV
jgi:NADH-quinone oxidoreductase subunit E